jgi:4-amino-4-deoxy-L-arabinose transferase-like glycosyltransferase
MSTIHQDSPVSPVQTVTRRGDAYYLAILFAAILALRIWLLFNTEVAARDSIGYIRYALQFDHQSWAEVLKANEQHPGYPLTLWLVSQPVRTIWGATPDTMRLCSQLVTSLAALLLLFPMYYLGKRLFDRQIGFWAALIFQILPVSGHHLSDGISDGLFLLLASSALLLGVRAVQEGNWRDFAWSGLLSGLAYLTRPEGLFVAAAVGVTLAGLQVLPATRRSWSKFLGQQGSLLAATAAVASLYVLATGALTNKLSPKLMWRGEMVEGKTEPVYSRDTASAKPRSEHDLPLSENGAALQANLFGAFFKSSPYFGQRLTRSFQALGQELGQGFHYLGIVPVLLGLWWHGRRLLCLPGFWVMLVYFSLQSAALMALATTVSYVSDRHVMVLVMCGSFFLAAGLRDLGAVMLTTLRRWRPSITWQPATVSLTICLCLVAYCLPKTLGRVHGNRQGNHAAGLWLARTVQTGDLVKDDHCWSHYYAGQVFQEGKEPHVPTNVRPTCYVVMTRSKDAEVDQRRQDEEHRLRDHGRLVYHWPERSSVEKARVVIYALPRDFQKDPWKVARTD